MQLNNMRDLRTAVKGGLAIAIATGIIFCNKLTVDPAAEQIVFAADYMTMRPVCGDGITGSSSFESDIYEDATITMTDMSSQITSAVCVSSDFNEDIVTANNNAWEKANQPVNTVHYNHGNLNAYHGVCAGPSGKETYYNLPMDGVVRIMRDKGYSEEEYPYWVRDDGVKMFGDYVMVAADLEIRPKGTILECSLGTAMVVDTGDFAKTNHTQLDIATSW